MTGYAHKTIFGYLLGVPVTFWGASPNPLPLPIPRVISFHIHEEWGGESFSSYLRMFSNLIRRISKANAFSTTALGFECGIQLQLTSAGLHCHCWIRNAHCIVKPFFANSRRKLKSLPTDFCGEKHLKTGNTIRKCSIWAYLREFQFNFFYWKCPCGIPLYLLYLQCLILLFTVATITCVFLNHHI